MSIGWTCHIYPRSSPPLYSALAILLSLSNIKSVSKAETHRKGNTMETYTTTQDYIAENIATGLGDITITDEQALEIAQEMTEWNEDGQLVEREDADFWAVVANVLGDN